MTLPEFMNIMEKWGYAINPKQHAGFHAYAQGMFNRRRAMLVRKGKSPEAIIFYFLTNNYEQLYKKGMWDLVPDNFLGRQIYIDKMLCRRWNKEIRNTVKKAIEAKFPWVLEAVYHRAPFDRCVKIISEYGKKEALLCSKY